MTLVQQLFRTVRLVGARQTSSFLTAAKPIVSVTSRTFSIRAAAFHPAQSKPLKSAKTTAKPKATKPKSAPKAKSKKESPKRSRVAKKAKANPKKPKVRKPTEKQVAKKKELDKRNRFRGLIQASLIRDEPKRRLITPYIAFTIRETPNVRSEKACSMTEAAAEVSRRFKELPETERKEVEAEAASISERRRKEYDQWLARHTPLQILEANAARRRINLLVKRKLTGFARAHVKLPLIVDERLVKSSKSPMNFFVMHNPPSAMGPSKTLADVVAAWKELPDEQRAKYAEMAAKDKPRYEREYQETYGRPPKTKRE